MCVNMMCTTHAPFFTVEDTITTGAVQTTDEEKRAMAAASLQWNLTHGGFKEMFPELNGGLEGLREPVPPQPQWTEAAANDGAAGKDGGGDGGVEGGGAEGRGGHDVRDGKNGGVGDGGGSGEGEGGGGGDAAAAEDAMGKLGLD